MGSSYTWHPGNCAVGPKWAIPVPLLPDEIISSWLVRTALALGCDPLVLTSQIWPKWRIWTQDSDRFFENEKLVPISAMAGIGRDILQAASLFPIAKRIQLNSPKEKAVWPWILTTGARNRKRHSGLQFCPLCLASDREPYFRIQWRFAWHSCCKIHNVSLLDRCQHCGSPIEPHRLIAEEKIITVCPTCHVDFRTAKSMTHSAGALAFQNGADSVLLNGKGIFCGTSLDGPDWFELSGFFISLLRHVNRGGTEALNTFMKLLDVEMPENRPLQTDYGFEMLRVHDRQRLLAPLYSLVSASKEHFDAALTESKISKQGFYGNGRNIPNLILQISEQLPSTPRVPGITYHPKATGPRPKHQVIRMMKKIQRKIEMSRQ